MRPVVPSSALWFWVLFESGLDLGIISCPSCHLTCTSALRFPVPYPLPTPACAWRAHVLSCPPAKQTWVSFTCGPVTPQPSCGQVFGTSWPITAQALRTPHPTTHPSPARAHSTLATHLHSIAGRSGGWTTSSGGGGGGETSALGAPGRCEATPQAGPDVGRTSRRCPPVSRPQAATPWSQAMC